MKWQLNQELFRFLVGLYLLSFGLIIALSVVEAFNPTWTAFSDEFDSLVGQHFGNSSETSRLIATTTGSILILWHIIAALAMRGFRRWGRWSFWITEILMILVLFFPGFGTVSYVSAMSSVIDGANLALFGAILLISYSHDHGVEWFKPPLDTLKETF